MRRSQIICATLALATLASPLLPDLMRIPVAVPMVLFVPGFVATKIAFPGQPLDLERLALAVGVSLAMTVLSGFALHLAAMLNATGWSIVIGGITLLLLPFAVWSDPSGQKFPAFDKRQKRSFCGAALLAVSALVLAGYGYLQHIEFRFTELWMVPAGGSLYAVGFANKEQKRASYDLDIVSKDGVIASWNGIALANGETWIRVIDLPIKTNRETEQRFTARLHNRADPVAEIEKVWVSIPPRRIKSPLQLSANGEADKRSPEDGVR
ncbi:hypothetical protein [Hyphomicrobium sp. 2TAF46]|uniref:hypothetical protein n=1 Tax=Hyphomicrobium sp. 2TAF46 TaxID=3233019 RepID=UPI003F933D99